MTTASLYRFFNKDGDLLYVGISSKLGNRFHEHSKNQPWYEEIVGSTVAHYPTREAALDAERDAIKAERPLYNVVHNRDKAAVPFAPPESSRDGVNDPNDALVGMWFHSPGPDGYPVQWQGQIIGTSPGDRYVVELYSWASTMANGCKVVPSSDIATWNLFRTNRDMNDEYTETVAPKIRRWHEARHGVGPRLG